MKINLKIKQKFSFLILLFFLLFIFLADTASAAAGDQCKSQGGVCVQSTIVNNAPVCPFTAPKYVDQAYQDCGTNLFCCKEQSGSQCQAAGGTCKSSGDSSSTEIGSLDCPNGNLCYKPKKTSSTVSTTSSGNFVYEPMEEIPGFGKPKTFPEYVLAVYKFGLWTIGIAAVLMISVGGYMYLTSAGNNSQVEKAKNIITDSIIGFILAMVSWIILYTINPDLISTNPLTQGVGVIGAAGRPGSIGGPSGTTAGYKTACPDPNSTTAIDYSKATSDKNIKLSSACDKYNFENSYGVDPCVLKAMAQMESNCGSNKGPSSAGACGLMQLLPSTAGKTCNELMDNDSLSIELAAKYISQNSSKPCVNSAKDKNSAIFAGYNSGYGCTGIACSPKHALCSSSDCSGALAFECCKSPGGLDESINYAWNGTGLYNQCK